jgi:hypothetical protein
MERDKAGSEEGFYGGGKGDVQFRQEAVVMPCMDRQGGVVLGCKGISQVNLFRLSFPHVIISGSD